MKTAQEYIQDARTDWPDGPVLVMTVEDAEAAVQSALDDAERYRLLLARSIRNAQQEPATAE